MSAPQARLGGAWVSPSRYFRRGGAWTLVGGGGAVNANAPAFINASTLSFPDSPMTITEGGTYTGLRISAGDSQHCVTVNTSSVVVFQDCDFRFTSGFGVYAPGGTVGGFAANPQLEFHNCRFFGEYPATSGQRIDKAIDYRAGKRLIVENCHFQRGRIYAYQHSALAEDVLRVRYNVGLNLESRTVDVNGDPTDTSTHIQFFQHNGRTNIAGLFEVAWNEVWNAPGLSRMEDAVNLFATGGTSTNPVLVHHNLVNGAYPYPLGVPSSYSGGGIMLSDGPGDMSYGVAEHNVVLASSNYGMAITAGDHFTIRNNRVFRTGLLPDGVTREMSGNGSGVYAHNYGDSAAWGDHAVQDNVWRWQDGIGGTNNTWFTNAGPNFVNTGNIAHPTVIDQSFIDAEVIAYRQAAATAGVTIGATREG